MQILCKEHLSPELYANVFDVLYEEGLVTMATKKMEDKLILSF